MTEGRIVKPLAVFIVVLVAILATTFLLGAVGLGTSGAPDGESINGQSPPQYQPDVVTVPVDPEDGEISIDTDATNEQILIDTEHDNQVSQSELEPTTEAVFDAGHSIDYGLSDNETFADSLDQYAGVLIVQPLSSYSSAEREALREYTERGGRVVILAEPTQTQTSLGGGQSATTVSFGATDLVKQYGLRVGAEQIYNVNDESNDNNFKSVYASPADESDLTAGVETVTFDTAGYVITNTDAERKFTAVEGTRTLETRRPITHPTAVRHDNVVFVADSTFITQSEVYDADNEVFIGNLLEFLLGGGMSSNNDNPGTQNGTAPERIGLSAGDSPTLPG